MDGLRKEGVELSAARSKTPLAAASPPRARFAGGDPAQV